MAAKKSELVLDKDGKFPLIPIHSIELAERPEEGSEDSKLFFNPRSLDSFDMEAMSALRDSIQRDGLQQPPIVRIFTENGKKDGQVTKIELIAGERRYRSIMKLYEDEADCYDEDSGENVSAKILYEQIPCKALYNIDDRQALRIAFKENNEHKGLTIQEEISLVERLTAMKMKQDEISNLLGTNVTWVSQTANFREELPEGAFEKLTAGLMSRHVAVQILGFSAADRERLYEEAVKAEKAERQKALDAIQEELDMAEDEEDIAISDHEEASEDGDVLSAKKANKKAKAAKKKAEKAKEKQEKIVNSEGVIKQGHIVAGGRQASVAPKKAKMLNRPTVEQFYVELIDVWLDRGKEDQETGKEFPPDVLKVMKMTAQAILSGNSEPQSAIRAYLVEEGIWEEAA